MLTGSQKRAGFVFLHTKIIVCTSDGADFERHPIAVRVIDSLLTESDVADISPQVAGEFVDTVARKGTPFATLTLQIHGDLVSGPNAPTPATRS